MAMAPMAAPGGGGPPPGMDMAAALGGGADAAPPEEHGSDVILTICDDGQGGFLVYDGDEPEEGETGDMSEEGVAAMGPGGEEPANSGQPAASMGEALKMAMDIMQKHGEGGPDGAQANFDAGFTGPQAPTPAGGGGGPGMPQKFPGA